MTDDEADGRLPGESPVDWWSAKRKSALRIFRNEGISGLWRKIGAGGVRQAASRVGEELRCMQSAFCGHLWDKRHNVQTSGLIGMEQVGVVGANKEHGNAIVSISPMMFRFFTRFFPPDRSSSILVDFGSGKGRLALMGSTLGFRKVIGVEYSPFAHNIAQDNLKAFRPAGAKAGECVFINADAADFKLPSEGSLTLFFNNPFGLEVWKRVLPNISARRKQCPGDVKIILVGSMPEMLEPVAHFISQSKDFEQVKKGVSPMFADSYSRYHYWVFEAS